jgi:oxygen-dependent protoporphyrinogen oxidase
MEPFVAGTLAADPNRASATATLPRLTALEHRYGSITAGIVVNRVLRRRQACVTDTFSFHGGMTTLIKTLAQTPGVQLRTGCTVNELVREKHRWRVTATGPDGRQHSLKAKQVVLTVPAPAAASLVAPLDTERQQLLQGIQHAPLAVVHLGMDRTGVGHPLDGTGFLSPRHEDSPLTGNLWMSTLFPDRAPPGKVLLTSYLGGARAPQTVDWNDARTLDATLHSLRRLLNLKTDPEMIHIDRHRQALPLYHGAYQARLQAITTRLQQHPGLHLEANYRGGVSVRDRIARARAVAMHLLAAQAQSPGVPALLPV